MSKLRKLIPVGIKRAGRSVLNELRLIAAYCYDYRRFSSLSGMSKKYKNDVSRGALITKYYHMIEKGLALPEPRYGFGRQAFHDLCLMLKCAILDDVCHHEVQLAVDALAGYRDFNIGGGVENPPWIDETIALAKTRGIAIAGHPTMERGRGAIDPADHLGFIISRGSVRNFADQLVPTDVLERAVQAAQAAPCVCNRQASKVYFVTEPELKRKVLACQNGNRGFGETTPVVAIITVDQAQFVEASERYQGWIDGGMFAMNLLLGIHALGYGACALNWSALPAQDRSLRRLGLYPCSENVVMLVAIGALKQSYKIARSARYKPTDVYSIVR
ncbi:MAG: nitroreductase family protein [Brevundimonas sp.]|uniref:nitroreductase family protein n=1 Tax=Brevundimonas sp. TaxID=1871086 RepID=UPI002732F3D9|nr:nitroreductase family protein [Brevundimonas sp.]MDP3405219.1 nitroreductase family protein [Brevundimonas sp.]